LIGLGAPRSRIASVLVGCLLGALVGAGPASAAFTSSRVNSPQNGAELFFNTDTASGSVTVTGTVSGATAGTRADLLCFFNNNQSATAPLVSGVNVSSGSFAFDVSLADVASEACTLRLVPAGTSPKGASAVPFAGPAISVADQQSFAGDGNLLGYYILSGTLSWSYEFGALGGWPIPNPGGTPLPDCPLVGSFATDATLTSYPLFAGNACLSASSGVSPLLGSRSALQIDGLNAYPPGAISALTGEAGFEPVTYSASFDAAHDTVSINETEIPTICSPPGTYPPTAGSCPSLRDSGIEVSQTSEVLPGGQVARVTQRFESVDSRPHTLDLLFSQEVAASGTGEVPGFEFPGQGVFAAHSAPDAFSEFGAGPGSIIVIDDSTAQPSGANPIGAITYSSPPQQADFISPRSSQTPTFVMHYVAHVPAAGSVVYNWSFSQAAGAAALAQLEAGERDRFYSPRVTITRPANRITTRLPTVLVRGTAADPIGLGSVTVDGLRATIGPGGRFSAVVPLRRGRNQIVVVATNLGGNSSSAARIVNYNPLPCIVPRLAGKTLARARSALASADCTAGRLLKARSRTVGRGRVISSSPVAGARLRPGGAVRLVVSRGP
jgi:hypothetical protein